MPLFLFKTLFVLIPVSSWLTPTDAQGNLFIFNLVSFRDPLGRNNNLVKQKFDIDLIILVLTCGIHNGQRRPRAIES